MSQHGKPVCAGLTRARVIPPVELGRRRARRRSAEWTIVFLAVLVAPVVGGYELWQWYGSARDAVPVDGTPRR